MKTLIAAIIALAPLTAAADGFTFDTDLSRSNGAYVGRIDIGYEVGNWTPYIVTGIATDKVTHDPLYGGGIRFDFDRNEFYADFSIAKSDHYDIENITFSMGWDH